MTDPTPTTADRITRVERAGLTFDVVDEGPLDGEPIVLLHGFPERATSWRLVVPALHEAGYRTLAPDQRGYSPGARPRRRRDYRLGELAADVVALIDRLGPDAKAHVVGHDWGAVVAWALALRHAKRVHTLTAVSVPHPAAYVDGLLRGQLVKSWYMAAFQLPFVPERLAGEGGLLERQLRRSSRTARCPRR